MKWIVGLLLAFALTVSAQDLRDLRTLFPEIGNQSSPTYETNSHLIRIVTLADGLAHPWSIAFLPNGDMLVTEQPGRLRLIQKGVLQPQAIAGSPEVHAVRHGGLLDIALHPDFATNRMVYLGYSKRGERGATIAISRAQFDGARLSNLHEIFVADAWSETDLNFGSRIVFGRDGMLYVAIGDRDERTRSQNPGDHAGKVLRLHDDGRVPRDNPFVGQSEFKPEIYSYGHRNPQGLTVHPETGAIWENEHGPMGGDEVNLILPGKNYGWPITTFGREYNGDPITDQPIRPGIESPRFFWVPSIGISGITFYTGNRFPAWKNYMFVGGLSGMQLSRVRLQGMGTNERESILMQMRHRIRDVRQGPDGLLYVVTDSAFDSPDSSGRVLRVEPAG